MEVLESIESLRSLPGPVFLGVGVFDGVHLGHQAVLQSAQNRATAAGGLALPLSFDPHPARILRPEAAPPQLTTRPQKLDLFKSLGFSHALLLRFDQSMAGTPADQFIRALAEAARPLGGICVGEDWAFGKGRSGNLDLLKRHGAEHHFEATGIQPVHFGGEAISSTRIRQCLSEGRLAEAAAMLGRSYALRATVEKGRKLGRTLGFPTANLPLADEQLPPFGVYTVRVHADGERYDGVANLGLRPTLQQAPETVRPLLEVHLLDATLDLYGRTLDVEFLNFLRPEQRFASLDQLREQIAQDVQAARGLLQNQRGHA